MMRALFGLAALAFAAPAAAQDHPHHPPLPSPTPASEPASAPPPAPMQEMDHCAMGHLPPDQCPPKDAEPPALPAAPTATMPEMDHCAMGHLPPDQCPPKDGAMKAGEPAHAGHRMDGMAMDAAAGGEHDMHAGHAMGPPPPDAPPPARAFAGPRHAADAIWGEAAMAPARAQLARENGGMTTGTVMLERLEYRAGDEDIYLWDAQAWYGGDIDRLFVKSEGEGEFGGPLESGEVQALWSHAIGPFFDLQLGGRYDFAPLERTYLVAGVQGLAPYMFHVDAAAFLSDEGDLTARIEGEYDQRITQRLILQPRVELELAAQDVPDLDIGSGLTKIETGLRLRYEIAREFAPYVGVGYEAALGRTADIVRADGRDPDGLSLLVGVRAWF